MMQTFDNALDLINFHDLERMLTTDFQSVSEYIKLLYLVLNFNYIPVKLNKWKVEQRVQSLTDISVESIWYVNKITDRL